MAVPMEWGFSPTTLSLVVDEIKTVSYDGAYPTQADLNSQLGGVAVVDSLTYGANQTGTFTVRAVTTGTKNIIPEGYPYPNGQGAAYDVSGSTPLSVTVSNPTEDTNYLSKRGLRHLWAKIKVALAGKQDALTAGKGISLDSNTVANRGDSVFYGTCATAAGTAAKVVVCDAFTSADLVTGTRITVKFDNNNSFNGQATLNINGTGAKNVYYTGSTTNARYMWIAGESVDFVYNGAQWATTNGGLATTTYYGVTKLATNAVSTSEVLALTPKTLNSYSQSMVSGAPAYSSSDTYAKGDRVRYSYQTWECNTAITTAEAWTAAHWTALDPLQTQIDALETAIAGISITAITDTEINNIMGVA